MTRPLTLRAGGLGQLSSIVVVKPSSLGDIVHTLPVLDLLRTHCPKARIEWVVNSVWAPILKSHPLLDGIIEFPRQAKLTDKLSWFLGQRSRRPDLVLDVQGLLRSALMARALHGRQIVGYSDAREGANLLHHNVVDVSVKRSPHAVDRYLTFFQALGIDPGPKAAFPLPKGNAPTGGVEIPLGKGYLLLHPFSRGEGKSLKVSQVRALLSRLDGIPAIVVGRTDEPNVDLPPGTVNLLNQTSLPELIWLLRQARWVVSVDSGPMHLAAAVSENLLSIHTWSDPLKVGPYTNQAWVWKEGRLTTMRDYRRDPSPTHEQTEFPDAAVEPLAAFLEKKWEG